MPYREVVEVAASLRRILIAILGVLALVWSGFAQEAVPPAPTAGGNTLIGCLSGPDADNHYTLSSMQHRMGVEVVGGDELKKGAGGKVKLTGAWETLPGAEGKKQSDATRRFKATEMTMIDEKCQPPAPVTPVSKKKQAQKK